METVFATVLSSLPEKRRIKILRHHEECRTSVFQVQSSIAQRWLNQNILKLCYIVKILLLVLGHSGIVIDLHVLCLLFLTSATLATTAAVSAADPKA